MNNTFRLKQGSLSTDQIMDATIQIWSDIAGSQDLQQKIKESAEASGLTVDESLFRASSPFTAFPDEEGLDPLSQFILISIAGGVTYDVAKYIFLKWIVPRIRARYGASAVYDEGDYR